MNKKILFLTITLLIFFMVFRPEIAVSSVKESILLWYTNVLPALFPTMILVKIFLSINIFFKKETPICILTGVLCGFPIGATTACEYVKRGAIIPEKGILYASLFNQFSPVFLTSIIGTYFDASKHMAPLLLTYIAPLMMLTVLLYKLKCQKTTPLPNMIKHKNETFTTDANYRVVDASIISSCEALIKICGYMVICNLFNVFLLEITGNQQLYFILAPILEVSGGIANLKQANMNARLYKSFLMACTSFGGISGFLQVNHILKDAHLSTKKYVVLKLVSAIITGLVTYIYAVICEHLT